MCRAPPIAWPQYQAPTFEKLSGGEGMWAWIKVKLLHNSEWRRTGKIITKFAWDELNTEQSIESCWYGLKFKLNRFLITFIWFLGAGASLVSVVLSGKNLSLFLDRKLIHRSLASNRCWYSFTDPGRMESLKKDQIGVEPGTLCVKGIYFINRANHEATKTIGKY